MAIVRVIRENVGARTLPNGTIVSPFASKINVPVAMSYVDTQSAGTITTSGTSGQLNCDAGVVMVGKSGEIWDITVTGNPVWMMAADAAGVAAVANRGRLLIVGMSYQFAVTFAKEYLSFIDAAE